MRAYIESSIRGALLAVADQKDLQLTFADVDQLAAAATTAALGDADTTGSLTLTNQQSACLVALARGERITDTARRLCVSLHTVKTHRVRLYRQLGAHTGAQAVAIAMHLGLLLPAARPALIARPSREKDTAAAATSTPPKTALPQAPSGSQP